MSEKPIKLLAVEDDPSLAFVLEEALEHAADAEIDAVMVSTLEAAKAELKRNGSGADAFEVVLLDLSLPDSNGLDTFSAVHAQAPVTPVIVLTGTDDPELEDRIRELGAVDFLLKGAIGSKALIRKIRSVARGYNEEPEAPQQD